MKVIIKMMQNILEEKTIQIQKHFPVLKKNYHVKGMAFFGSIVRQDFNQKSDIDVMVEFSEPISFFKFIELERYLSSLLGVKVDLVTKNALKSSIKDSILKEAVYV